MPVFATGRAVSAPEISPRAEYALVKMFTGWSLDDAWSRRANV